MNETMKTIITALVGGGVTLLGSFYTFKGKKTESDANISKAYIAGNNHLFQNLQSEITRLSNEMAVLKKEMEDMRKNHEHEIDRFEKENGDLKNKLRDAKAENKYLKEKLELSD